MIKLEDKLYTSTEVADILGVSLRSVYRYIEENKLKAEVKTATGRHRFTKQNIIDFLYPEGEPSDEVQSKRELPESRSQMEPKPEIKKSSEERNDFSPEPKKEEAEVRHVESTTRNTPVAEPEPEPVDWLAKFREAAKKFEEESKIEYEEKPEPKYDPFSSMGATEERYQAPKVAQKYFYRSRLGGLKDIAQNIDKASKNSAMDYAFTLNAGLSLHSPIKPFSILHAYVRPKDKDFFERILMLTASDEDNAQLCLIASDDTAIYSNKVEMHGLSVVSKERLLSDIQKSGDNSLTKEAESILG